MPFISQLTRIRHSRPNCATELPGLNLSSIYASYVPKTPAAALDQIATHADDQLPESIGQSRVAEMGRRGTTSLEPHRSMRRKEDGLLRPGVDGGHDCFWVGAVGVRWDRRHRRLEAAACCLI